MSDYGFLSLLLKAIYFIIVFGIIIFFAYYITKLIGRRVSSNSGKYMRIVDVLYMGTDRSLVIVKVGSEFLLLASTGKGIELLEKMEGFEENFDEGENFSTYLNKYNRTYRGGIGVIKGIKNKFTGGVGPDEDP